MKQTTGFFVGLREPEESTSFALMLRPLKPPQGLAGLLLAIAGFALLLPLVREAIVFVFFLLRGAEDYDVYRNLAHAYQLPEGLFASHLALACLTLIAMGVARAVHGRRPGWLFSVHYGLRWRYLLAAGLLAAVILNALFWISFFWEPMPEFHGGQEGAGWFLLAIVLASPLQAAAEEVFFRGYLMQVFGSLSSRIWVGVVASAAVFALFHGVQNPALFAHRFAFGLIAGTLAQVTGGLEAAMAAHVVNNLGAFSYAVFSIGVAQARAITETSWAKTLWDLLTFTLFALAAFWISRRMRVQTRTTQNA